MRRADARLRCRLAPGRVERRTSEPSCPSHDVLFPDGAVGVLVFEVFDQALVEGMGAEGRGVADQQQLAAGAGHSDVHAADVGQETDLAAGVAADQRNDDRFLLPALKAVHAVDLQAGHGQPLTQQPDLSGVRSDDGHIGGRKPRVQQFLDFADDQR